MARKPGRPKGSSIDDEALLDAVEALRRANPALSCRAAIIEAASDDGPHLIRRIERKLAERVAMRAGDVRLLDAKPFEKGEPREGRTWSCLVDVPVEGRGDIAVCHSVVVGLPVLLVTEDERPIEGRLVPEHHVLRAVDRLPRRHGWDDPGYRACCGALGIDPDRERVPLTPRLEGEAARMRDLAVARKRPDGYDLAMAEDILCVTRYGELSPYGLARLHARYEDDDSDEGAGMRAEAREAFNKVDWGKSRQSTTLRWLAGPFGYDHHASIYFLGKERDGLMSVSGKPEIIPAPDPQDWVATHAARLTERHCMALTLSPAEMASFASGGDRAYWLAVRDWGTKPWARARAEITRPDLSMTHAILDAMTANAYAMYVARATGAVPVPDTPLSHETRAPFAPSRPSSRTRMVAGFLRRAVRELAGKPGLPRPWRPDTGGMFTRWGEVVVAEHDGAVVVRNGRFPLRVGEAQVRLSAEFLPAFDWRGLPMVDLPQFEMVDLRTGKPLPATEALPVLDYLSGTVCVQAGKPGFHTHVIPPAWALGGRVAAGFAAAAMIWWLALSPVPEASAGAAGIGVPTLSVEVGR